MGGAKSAVGSRDLCLFVSRLQDSPVRSKKSFIMGEGGKPRTPSEWDTLAAQHLRESSNVLKRAFSLGFGVSSVSETMKVGLRLGAAAGAPRPSSKGMDCCCRPSGSCRTRWTRSRQ